MWTDVGFTDASNALLAHGHTDRRPDLSSAYVALIWTGLPSPTLQYHGPYSPDLRRRRLITTELFDISSRERVQQQPELARSSWARTARDSREITLSHVPNDNLLAMRNIVRLIELFGVNQSAGSTIIPPDE